MRRAPYIIVVICGIIGGWVGYWIGQPTASVRYWIGQPIVSTSDFAWWSKNVDLPAGLQHRLAGLAGEQLFPLWRFLLSMGMAALFVCVAALVVTLLPAWRAQKVLENGTPAEATVVRVEKTGERRQARGREGVERQLACELEVCPEGGSVYRARTTQFFTESAQLALQPGAGVVVRYDPARPKRVAIVEPVAK
jgi:Protein of unknown function (DUF3592)